MEAQGRGSRVGDNPNSMAVKQEVVIVQGVSYFISTIDLGHNHSFGEAPMYFETMVFAAEDKPYMYTARYSTKEVALATHEEIVKQVNSGTIDEWFKGRIG